MKRLLLLTIILYLLLLTCASAEIFRCRTPDGELVMTDDKSKLPADCQPVEAPAGSGSFNVVPSTPSAAVESSSVSPKPEVRSEAQDVAPWQDDANGLVERYNDALLRSHREDLEVNRRSATRDVEQVKQQKIDMLDALPKSGLKDHEQKAVRETLSKMPKR
jgi:hypothetical protein